jgi:nitroreductase / dihydropteridine reductase
VEFKDIVKNRCAVRQYEPKVVPEETIRELLEMICYSASAINLQPWKIKVVADQATKEKLFPVSFNQPQITGCSHLLVLCADTDYPAIIAKLDAAIAAIGAPDDMRAFVIGMATDVAGRMTPQEQLQWSKEQVYIALGNALNGAYSLSLGACPMTAFDPAEYSRILGLPETIVPTVLVSVGYPAGDAPAGKLRYSVDDILV